MNFYGLQDQDSEAFCGFLEEFKNLRGDYGIRQDDHLTEKLCPDIHKLHQKLK